VDVWKAWRWGRSGGTLRHAEIGNELNPARFSTGNAWKIEMDRDVLNGASKMQQP
jgi:hypothetical protein